MKYANQNRMLQIFKALANVNRLEILAIINASKAGSVTVSEMVAKMEISQPSISDHLKIMRIQKIIRAKQDGINMYYSIREPLVTELIRRMN